MNAWLYVPAIATMLAVLGFVVALRRARRNKMITPRHRSAMTVLLIGLLCTVMGVCMGVAVNWVEEHRSISTGLDTALSVIFSILFFGGLLIVTMGRTGVVQEMRWQEAARATVRKTQVPQSEPDLWEWDNGPLDAYYKELDEERARRDARKSKNGPREWAHANGT